MNIEKVVMDGYGYKLVRKWLSDTISPVHYQSLVYLTADIPYRTVGNRWRIYSHSIDNIVLEIDNCDIDIMFRLAFGI
jgi:hypothetical protein